MTAAFNVRASTVLGVVGAGGIGQELKNSMDLLDFARLFTIIAVILVVVKAFNGHAAIEDVSFAMGEHEFVGVLGPRAPEKRRYSAASRVSWRRIVAPPGSVTMISQRSAAGAVASPWCCSSSTL
jgi:hypothetical protein